MKGAEDNTHPPSCLRLLCSALNTPIAWVSCNNTYRLKQPWHKLLVLDCDAVVAQVLQLLYRLELCAVCA